MRTAMALLLAAELLPRAVIGQADASLGLGAGTVRYAGGSSLATVSLSPGFTFDRPAFSTALNGTLASLPGGSWFAQGRTDTWASTAPLAGPLRLGGELLLSGTTRTDGSATGQADGVAELVWNRGNWGAAAGAGPSSGWITAGAPITAFHARARGWWDHRGVEYSAAIEPTRFLGYWYTDLSGGGTLARGPVTFSVWGTARVSRQYGSRGSGSAFVQWFVAPQVAIEVGAGNYLPDPYQGFPGAGYLTAGVRLFHVARKAPGPPPLLPERRGDSLVVRFKMEGARAVAIAGDWDQWQPLPLTSVGEDLWEGVLALGPGVHHFNLLVDGKDWVVPRGVAFVSDGMGGMVGVIVVP
ncbi:MAG TPA: glycogen-binding domain-containing protein [Gemmatimonadales bacterium]|nr:glycogen-binding domain-containing protein [Gemmatimonadales bacterium]